MSEEIQNEPGEGQTNEVTLTPVEQEALSQGWVPKEQFDGDEHYWVDAGEFLRRGELFKKIELQSRELKDVKKALVEIKKLHADVREIEYKRALDTLKAEKRQALVDGDADAVISADERIDLIKEQQRQLAVEVVDEPAQSGANHPEFVAWTNKNQWYTSNAPMRAFANELGNELAAQGLTPVEVLKRVEQEVRKEFPHKFQNPKQNRASGVEAPTGGKTSAGQFQLSADERRVMNTLIRTGTMTEAEYIRDLKKVRGV